MSILSDALTITTSPAGTEFVRPVVGYFCNLCQVIYVDEDEAKVEHCSTTAHYRKYQVRISFLSPEEAGFSKCQLMRQSFIFAGEDGQKSVDLLNVEAQVRTSLIDLLFTVRSTSSSEMC